jgi:DNA invertase Pin-like site-specific DNA recombinase
MGILIGYARVSTGEQNLDLQIDALGVAGCERTRIYTDELSGVKVERPGLQEAWKQLRSGDTLVVWRLDRLGRSLKDLVNRIEELQQRGIGFRSLQEALDTTTAAGKLQFHVFSALAVRARADSGAHDGGTPCGAGSRANGRAAQGDDPGKGALGRSTDE